MVSGIRRPPADGPRAAAPLRPVSTASWRAPEVRVSPVSAGDGAAADALAERLSLPLGAARPPTRPGTWTLHVDGERRVLERADGVTLELDFTAGRTAARQRESGLARQPLARALGVPRLRRRLGRAPAIVDATGGLGRDAWFAASLGCPVTVIERSGIVHALLAAALARAAATTATSAVAARVTLLHDEATRALGALDPDDVDVVYLDPMYPPTRRRAAVTKGMQFLHELLGPPESASMGAAGPADGERTLLGAALDAAAVQVTVKRPGGAPPLAGHDAFDGQLATVESPGTRYDLYLKGSSVPQSAPRPPSGCRTTKP